MAKFNENELTEKLKEYEENAKINLEFERGIDGKIEIDNASVKYNHQTGFIKIFGEKCDLQVNTTMVCGYEKIGNVIKIDLDTVMLKITK